MINSSIQHTILIISKQKLVVSKNEYIFQNFTVFKIFKHNSLLILKKLTKKLPVIIHETSFQRIVVDQKCQSHASRTTGFHG